MEDLFPETIMGYRFNEVPIVEEKFMKFFGVPFKRFYDGVMSVAFGKLLIGIFSFDDYLHEKFGMYENDKKSMKEVIIENYGIDASDFISKLLC